MSHQEHAPIAAHGSALESRYAGENDTLIRMRHSAAHMMAEAVLALFPEAKLGIGPPIEDGFYYDFLLPRTLTPDDLPEIENRMRQSAAAASPFVASELPREDGLVRFADQPFKVEIIESLTDETVSTYTHREFTDPVPRATRGVDGQDGGVQADARGGGVLAGQRGQSAVAAHLWGAVRDAGRA